MSRFRKYGKLGFSVLAAIVLLAAMPGPTPAQAAGDAFTISQSFPIDLPVFVPCADGGAGEVVELTGNLHDLFHVTFTANGGLTLKTIDNPQGISGTGQTTGVKYQGTGETSDVVNGKVGYEETFTNNFRIIGQGPGNNFLVHENYHVTVNANGTLTAFVDNLSVDCK